MFQVLALTGLYLPPRAQMTQADWKDVHCHGDSECHVMKTKALAPELQVVTNAVLRQIIPHCCVFLKIRSASVAAQAKRAEGTAARGR